MHRREFIKRSGTALGAGLLGTLVHGCAVKDRVGASRWRGFKYAMCNESMQPLPWEKQCEIVAAAGYTGIEIAPFSLVKESVHELSPAKRKEMLRVMKSAGLSCAGLHWLLAPPPAGLHITTPDAAVRKKTLAYLGALIDFCADLEGDVMIFGSPKQRGTQGISVEQARKNLADGFRAVSHHAQRRGVKILLEHLGSRQTDVVNTLAEAKAVMDAVNHPAIRMMFDFHNTPDETEPFDVLIRRFFPCIYHVHVQEMDGKYLGTGNAVNDFVKGFQVLKDLRFDRWVSLEVFDFSPGGKVIAEESMKVLKQIEAKLS